MWQKQGNGEARQGIREDRGGEHRHPAGGSPGGSWWQSARNAKVDGDTLTAELKNLASVWVESKITFKDGETFEIDDGRFLKTGPLCKV